MNRLQQAFSHFLANSLPASNLLNSEDRIPLYRLQGMKIGAGAYISSQCHFVYPDLSNIKIGEKAFLNQFCYLENGGDISIGKNSCLAPYVRILTTTHDIGGAERRVGNSCVRKSVTIGEGCWIGSGVVILPGLSIGSGVVIGAGAVVTHDCLDNGLYLGFPAARVRDLGVKV